MKLILIIGLSIFYFTRMYLYIQQEVLIKDKIRSLNDARKKMIFFLIDILGLIILILQLLNIISYKITILDNSSMKIIGCSLFILGVFISTYSRIYLGKNWDTAGNSGIRINHKLITSGPYSILRHPIYLGTLCFFIGLEILLYSWLILLAIPLFIIIQWESTREENMLLKYFPRYKEYKKRVKKF